MAHFEYREQSGFKPQYGGIDWYELRTQKCHEYNVLIGEVWFCVNEEDGIYEQQVTQENTWIDLNAVNENIDRIGVEDERDHDAWVFYRDETPNFDETLKTIGAFALVTYSLYPQEQVVKDYELRKLQQIDEDIDNFIV